MVSSRERFVGVARHTGMNRTTDLDIDDMGATEHELSERLAAAGQLMPLNPDALAEVRGRAGKHRRVPVRPLVASAAAVLAVVALVGTVERAARPVHVVFASATSSAGTTPGAGSSSTPAPNDGVLLVYDFPNSDEPEAAGEWMTLNTPDWSYQWRGAPDSLPRSGETRQASGVARLLDVIDSTASAPSDEVIQKVVQAAADAPLDELGDENGPWDDTDRHRYVFETLARIIESGLATPSQTARILQVLQSAPDVEVRILDDGLVQATFTPVGGYLTVDANSARPVASSYSGDSTSTKRYLSVAPVVSDDLLTPQTTADLSTTSSTAPSTSDTEPR